MVDVNEIRREYALSYADKARIYFIEKYLSTFNADAGKRTQFMLFPRQKAFLQSIAEHGRSIAIKHRQAGITTVTSAWVAAQMALADKDQPETVLCIGNKLDLANQLVTKIREFLMQVPRWYWGNEYYSPDPKDPKNTKDIFTKNSKSELQLFNGCAVYARSSGENAARGISAVSILIFDEAAFIENGPAVYSSAVAATSSYGDRAKIVMVSTPNGKDELYYNTYRQALTKENNYNAVEFKWYQDLRYNKFLTWSKKNEDTGEVEIIKEETLDETGTIKYDEEKWRELERNGWKPMSPWYDSMCKSFNNDTMKIAQELDVSFMGSSDNVIAPEYIEMQDKLNVREPLEDYKDPLVEETWFWKLPIEGHRYILACLPEGEQVMTQRGLVNVEDINDDDLLVTKDGQYTKIKTRMMREAENEEIITIKPHNFIDSVSFTNNHPIWCSTDSKIKWVSENGKRFRKINHEFSFKNASEVKNGSWLEIPNTYRLNILSEKNILEKWKTYDKPFNNQNKPIENPLLNEDFWWYCGIWLAEGYTHNNNVVTVHHIKENEYHNKINDICNNLFNRKTNFINPENTNALKMFFSSVQLVHFLHDTFGKYADGKHISEWVKFLPNNFKINLIKGYFDGDGCYQRNRIVAASISKKLLNDIQDILLSLGIVSSIIKKYDTHYESWGNKMVLKRPEYVLNLANCARNNLLKLYGIDSENNINKVVRNGFVHFSEDLSKIYMKVENVSKTKETCKVYNFETESDSHTFCCRGIATHNCDPSRGTASDRTAIEVIDMDGRDENGLPIIEQVAEYVGKKLGDDIGAICYQYATMYNDAFIVVDSTGGQGDAAIITMLQMGYKNMYYEDMNQKTYTIQKSTKIYDSYTDKLPGFHFQGNRYPVLANFAGLVRNNEFKIRSARVINELDTWIFKGENGRMDHMEGAHDDTITSLAMGLFVMQYSVNRLQSTIKKDKAILNAYRMGTGFVQKQNKVTNGSPISPKSGLPFYSGNKILKKYDGTINGSCLWLLSGYK